MTEAAPDSAAEPSSGRAQSAVGRHGWTAARLVIFATVTIILAFGDVREIDQRVVGNPGDAYLIMTVLDWGSRHFLDILGGYWSGPMFSSADAAMAYSDTFLPLTLPFAVLKLLTGSRTVAFNILYLASWVFCAEATYHLARRVLRSRPVAAVAAVAFTFSAIRLAQALHFQLAWGGLIPLTLLLLFRYRDHPSAGRAIALAGAAISALLISAYYGVVLLVFSAAFVAIEFVIAARGQNWRPMLLPTLAFFGAVLAIVGPIQYIYSEAGASAVPRDVYPEFGELHPGDLRSPDPTADLPRRLPFLDPEPDGRSENFAYVGMFVLVFVPVALLVLCSADARARVRANLTEWAWILALGLFGVLFAVGRGPAFGVEIPFYDIAVAIVPGLDSVTALVRMFVFTQLALVMVAAWGLEALLRSRRRGVAVAAVAAVGTIVIAEAKQDHFMVRVAEPADGSVYTAMRELDAGEVLELPIPGRERGVIFAFIESTRMLASVDDDLQSFNGYSGYWPKGYDDAVTALGGFPSPAALEQIRSNGIDYVVLHAAPIDAGHPGISDSLNASGAAYFPPDEIERILAELPEGLVRERIDADDGIILVLTD